MLRPEEVVVHELQRSQWLSREEIERNRRPLLERLLRHAATQSDYYRDRCASLFGGNDPETAPIDWSRWSDLPVLTRAEVLENKEDIFARSLPADAGSYVIRRSSGTTNQPLEFRRSAISIAVSNCQLNRVYELHEFDLSGSLAHITHDATGQSSYPAGSRGKGWNVSVPDAKLYSLEVRTPTIEQLDWLERVGPTYVMTYPNNLRAIAELALRRGNSNLKFKTFIATGEVLEDEAREVISRAFGCSVVDIYGAREVGPIAFQCPDADTYHLCAETVICELLNENGLPARSGEYGRVVVTPLYEYAMPLIRYDLGDYMLLSPVPCSCGRGLPSIDRVAGRVRNLFVMPDGTKLWPPMGPISKTLTKFMSYKQIQFIQAGVDQLEIRYVPDGAGEAPDLGRITELLRGEFHPRLQVVLAPVDRIERGAGMKIEQFVSLVGERS